MSTAAQSQAQHKVVSESEWVAARKELLASHLSDAVFVTARGGAIPLDDLFLVSHRFVMVRI